MKDEIKEHDLIRKKLWADVWAYTAGASNSTHAEACTKWADRALKDFDERFPKPKTEE